MPLVLAALLGAFYWSMFAVGTRYQTYLGGDFAYHLYPNREMMSAIAQSGTFPLWNPYAWSGHPMAADAAHGVFYLPEFFTIWFRGESLFVLLELIMVLHLLLGGCFMGLLMRLLGLGRAGALAAAACFMFNGYFQFHQRHSNLLEAAVWLPGIMLFLVLAIRERRIRHVAVAGICLGMSSLTGFVEVVAYILAAMLSYALYEAVGVMRRTRSVVNSASARPVLLTGAAICIGLGIGSVQLIPMHELSTMSAHTGYTFEKATQLSVTPANLTAILIPGVTDGRSMIYCGAFAFLLALFGLWVGPRRYTAFLAGLALVSVALSLGRYSPAYHVLYRFVPGFGCFRSPERWLLLYVFAVAGLAGFGVDGLETLPRARAIRPLRHLRNALPMLSLLGIAAAVALRDNSVNDRDLAYHTAVFGVIAGSAMWLGSAKVNGRWSGSVVATAAIALLVFEAFAVTRRHEHAPGGGNPFVYYLQPRQVAAMLADDRGIYRVANEGQGGMTNNWVGMMGLEYTEGYGPLPLARYVKYVNRSHQNPALLDMLNVKYVLSGFELARVNETYLPRCFLVDRYVVEPDAERALTNLRARGVVDLGHCVVLEERPRNSGSTTRVEWDSAAEPVGPRPGSCRVTERGPNSLKVSLRSQRDAFLVLSEVFYPGWEARLDGRDVEVLRANYIFRAVFVPRGEHVVSFRYRPRSLFWGGLVTAGFMMLALSMLISKAKV